MKKNGTHIFTVAVGDAATKNVQALASLPLSKYYYNVSNEAFLPLILHKMVLSMCHREEREAFAPPPLPPPLPPQRPVVSAAVLRRRRNLRSAFDYAPVAAAPFDCGDNGPGRWLVLRNQALNPLRVRTCTLDFNKEVCKGGAQGSAGYKQCAPGGDALAFVPANSTVTLRVPMNVTYIVTIFCVDLPGKSVHCLSAPQAPEFYGPAEGKGGFPAGGLVIPPSAGIYCSVDLDCPSGQKCTGGTAAAPVCA